MRVNLLITHGTVKRYRRRCRCGPCRAAKAEYNRCHYKANREQVREGQLRYYAADREGQAERVRRYYEAHPEKKAEADRRYRESHREVRRAVNRKRKARKRNATGSHTAADIASQYERQRGRCYWCKAKGRQRVPCRPCSAAVPRRRKRPRESCGRVPPLQLHQAHRASHGLRGGDAVMATVLARLIREDTAHELRREDDGRTVLRLFVHDADMDREVTPEEAMEWCDTVRRCGGTVNRRITSWPAKAVGA